MKKLIGFIKKENGFNVIELIIAVAISSIIIVAAYNFYFSFYDNWTNAEQDSSIIDDLNFIEFVLSKDIRSAVPTNTEKPIKLINYNTFDDDSDGNIDRRTSDQLHLYKETESGNYLLIEYELMNNGNLIRRDKTSTNTSDPYNFPDAWENSKLISGDINQKDIFTEFIPRDSSGDIININPREILVEITINRNNRSETLDFKAVSRSKGN